MYSESFVEHFRNGEGSFVENRRQDFYLSCLQSLGNLPGELSPGGIGLEHQNQTVRQPSQGNRIAILAERRSVDQDVIEFIAQF